MLLIFRTMISVIIGFTLTPLHQAPSEFYSENKKSRILVQEQLPNYLYTVKESKTNTIRYQFILDCKAEKIFLSNDGERAVIFTFTPKPQDGQAYVYVHSTGICSRYTLATLLPKSDLKTKWSLLLPFELSKPWYTRSLCFFDDAQKKFLVFSERGNCLIFDFLTGKANVASSRAKKSWIPQATQKIENLINEVGSESYGISLSEIVFLKYKDLKRVAVDTLQQKLERTKIESHFGTLQVLIQLGGASLAIQHFKRKKEDYIKLDKGVSFLTLMYAKDRSVDAFLRELDHEFSLKNTLINVRAFRQFTYFRTLTDNEEIDRLMYLNAH